MRIWFRETEQALGRRAPLNMDFDTMRAKTGEQEGIICTDERMYIRLRYEYGDRLELQVIDGETYPFERLGNGYWILSLADFHEFCYVKVMLDGNWVLSPYLPIGYGDNHPMNFLDLSDNRESEATIAAHGTICREQYHAHVSRRDKFCYIYTPPGYADENEKYPILYLQHGYGENELGWLYQGRLAETVDRLIYSGKIKPMLIVMADGMMRCTEENGSVVHRPELFTEELIEDIMPLVENRYRVKNGGKYHAIAGLSMGSLQTCMTVFNNPGLFEWAGLFSGFMSNIFDGNDTHLENLKQNADSFEHSIRLFFRAMGKDDPFWPVFEKDDRFCEEYGIRCVRKVYDGAHTWNVWRSCIKDFLPLLFREND